MWRNLGRYATAVALVAAATFAAHILFSYYAVARLSPVFLTAVLLSGAYAGTRPALLAAVASFSIFNVFFVEPRFELRLADTEDYLNLVVFLGVALLTGGLSGRLRDRTETSREQARLLGVLFRAGQTMSVSSDDDFIYAAVARGIAEIAGGDVGLYRDGNLVFLEGAAPGPAAQAQIDRLVASCAADEAVRTFSRGDWLARAVRLEEGFVAALVWRSAVDPSWGERDQVLNLLVDLGAATLARTRLTAAGAEAAAAARVENLRTALLSSLSHDFRTPLSAILASSTSLADFGDDLPPADRRDLAMNIRDESQTLGRYVENLLSMTRLESGAVVLRSSRVKGLEIVHEVAERLERRGHVGRIEVADLAGETCLAADPLLLAQALTNVVENALRLSPATAPVRIEVDRAGRMASITVTDQGPGAPADALSALFEKFFRLGAEKAGSGGLGLGLSIAKGLVEAMEGDIEARNRPDRRGLAVTIRLPLDVAS